VQQKGMDQKDPDQEKASKIGQQQNFYNNTGTGTVSQIRILKNQEFQL